MKATEMNYKACRNLGCAIALQAAKDFFDNPWESEGIINMLNSPYMNLLTNGLSIKLAEKLKTNPEQIKSAIMREEEEE